jgi:hypothetical protein
MTDNTWICSLIFISLAFRLTYFVLFDKILLAYRVVWTISGAGELYGKKCSVLFHTLVHEARLANILLQNSLDGITVCFSK